MTEFYIILFSISLLGAVMGSFVNMAATRLPAGADLVFKRSHCPKCKSTLRLQDLFPVLSWLLLRGKCRYCRTKIGIRYFLVEISLASVFAAVFFRYGVSEETILLLIAAVAIALIVVVDFEHYIIPDSCQAVLLVTGAYYAYSRDMGWDAPFGGAMGLSLGLFLHWFYKKFRGKDALGLGDVKLLGVGGVWLGWLSFIPFIFYSGFFGVITGAVWQRATGSRIFPFGPALAMTLLAMVCYPELAEIFWHSLNYPASRNF